MSDKSNDKGEPDGAQNHRKGSVAKYFDRIRSAVVPALKHFWNRKGEKTADYDENSPDERMARATDRMADATDKMASYTKILAALTAFSIAAAILTACLLKRQIDSAELEQRPWISADVPIFVKPIASNVAGVWQTTIEFTLHNTGKLPAMNTNIIIQSPGFSFLQDPEEIEKYHRLSCVHKPNLIRNGGDTIFPEQTIKRRITYYYEPETWNESVTATGHPEPWIIGCVGYFIPNSDVRHFTRFAYKVRLKGAEGEYGEDVPSEPSTTPASDLKAEPFDYRQSFLAD